MPNHVQNRITIHAAKSEHDRIRERFLLKDVDAPDFQRIIPVPGVYLGSANYVHDKLFGERRTFSSGCTAAWGTKWGPYDVKTAESTDEAMVLSFQTAWNAPHPIVFEIAKTIGFRMTHEWSCEGGCTWGRIQYDERGITEHISSVVGEYQEYSSANQASHETVTEESMYALLWPERAEAQAESEDEDGNG